MQAQQQMKEQAGQFTESANVDPGFIGGNVFHQAVDHNSDEELDGMDDEEEQIMRQVREKRMAEMKSNYEQIQENKIMGHGQYIEITETEFLPNVTGSKFVICHFYHKDFERCKIIDMHLREIAKTHLEARFVYLNAEKSPFFIQKLQIQVLPTILCFVDGIALDRVVGFADLGNRDDFPRLTLTRRLIRSGALKALNKQEAG